MQFQAYLTLLNQYLPFIEITALTWVTYFYTLKCGFVSDDLPGIGDYDGKLQSWEYGTLWRWLRYHICGGNRPSGKKNPDGSDIPQGKLPIRHHFLSLVTFNLTNLVIFLALKPIIGEQTALLSVFILIVHPCTTQGVAWISGLAYPLSLLWISLSIILMQFFYANLNLNNAMWVIPVFCLIQFLAIHAIFATTAMTWAILLFLGYWQFAILSFILSGVMCFDQIRKTIDLRVSEFKKQNMAESTFINPGKFVVMMKTLWYYICHSIAPICMGLYHTWGFHYSKDLERRDRMFWLGFFSFCGLIYVFLTTDLIGIKLGILWYLAFSVGFWNLITAQQFVTERYIMVANLGLGLIIATLTYEYPSLYWFIVGAYLCRTWCHLPTYDNELRFYLSNTWNFPKSEVAYGNLGVTYARIGMSESAKDSWLISTQINPEYDVPWVNIFYQYRTKGSVMINNGDYQGGIKTLQEGLPFLEKAMNCKVCHFPEQWKKEYAEVMNSIKNPGVLLEGELGRLLKLKYDLKARRLKATPQEIQGINESLVNNEKQMANLVEIFKVNKFVCMNPTNFNQYYSERALDNLTRR